MSGEVVLEGISVREDRGGMGIRPLLRRMDVSTGRDQGGGRDGRRRWIGRVASEIGGGGGDVRVVGWKRWQSSSCPAKPA